MSAATVLRLGARRVTNPPLQVTWTATCPACLGFATWRQIEGHSPVVDCLCENWRNAS